MLTHLTSWHRSKHCLSLFSLRFVSTTFLLSFLRGEKRKKKKRRRRRRERVKRQRNTRLDKLPVDCNNHSVFTRCEVEYQFKYYFIAPPRTPLSSTIWSRPILTKSPEINYPGIQWKHVDRKSKRKLKTLFSLSCWEAEKKERRDEPEQRH